MSNYELVVLCGKSGAGKNYLLQKIKEYYKDKLNYIISDTTRPPRMGEVNGIDYNFISSEEFYNSKYIEKTSYETEEGVWYYGTSKQSLDPYRINIGIFNLEGVDNLYKNDNLRLHLFYISADDRTRLLRQMNREKYPDYKEICRRFLADEKDFKNLYKYPFRKIRNSSGLIDDQCATIIIEEIGEILTDFDKIRQ